MSKFYRAILLPISSLFLLAGCVAVGPDYSSPASPLPINFGQTATGLTSGEVEVAWWNSFGDATLTKLIQQALTANHDIGIAAMRLEEAKAVLGRERQDYLPTGGAAFNYQDRRQSRFETAPEQSRHSETYRGTVDTSWELDLFGRVRRSVEMAEAQVGSREALLRGVQASVAAEVATTWFELQGLEAELAVVTDIRRSQRESFAMITRQVNSGAASEFDQLRAEALLRNIEVAVPELEQRRAVSLNALSILLGEAPQTFKLAKVSSKEQEPAILTIAIGDPVALLSRRADIMAAERNLAAASAQIGIETAGLYPDVQVQGSIGLVAGSFSGMSGAGALSSFIGPVIRWSFLDIGRVRAQIAMSEARSKQALITYDQTLLRALQETDDAFKAYGASNQQLELRLLESAANHEAARLAQARFSEGEGIYLDVLEAERTDFVSQRALVTARTYQQLTIVSIYKALGGGWQVCSEGEQECSGADGRPKTNIIK